MWGITANAHTHTQNHTQSRQMKSWKKTASRNWGKMNIISRTKGINTRTQDCKHTQEEYPTKDVVKRVRKRAKRRRHQTEIKQKEYMENVSLNSNIGRKQQQKSLAQWLLDIGMHYACNVRLLFAARIRPHGSTPAHKHTHTRTKEEESPSDWLHSVDAHTHTQAHTFHFGWFPCLPSPSTYDTWFNLCCLRTKLYKQPKHCLLSLSLCFLFISLFIYTSYISFRMHLLGEPFVLWHLSLWCIIFVLLTLWIYW